MQPAEDLKIYVSAFEKELGRITADKISPEPYCKKYLSHLLAHKKYYLAIYADVLQKLLENSEKNKDNITIVDYGSGNGLLGIFAKFCGFKKVILNDIDAKFIAASRELSKQLNIYPDAYITGDIESLKLYCKTEIPDAIIGTDVIEHIYSLEEFLFGLRDINPFIVSVFTTASNPLNYFKVRSLKKAQVKDELKGGEPGDHALFGETALIPFITMREQIIKKNFHSLSIHDVTSLTVATRGMKEADILKTVENYLLTKQLPIPAEGSNTCNPLNGSWTERILPMDTYISLYRAAGFTCKIYAGFYNEYEGDFPSFVKKLLNVLIAVIGKRISPYIVIVGGRN